jgi:hypothetical protein
MAEADKSIQTEAVLASSAPSGADENVLETLKKENLEMQKEIEKREQMLAKRQELRAREMLGGRAPISNTPTESPEAKKKREALEFWKGSEIERAIEKHG